MRLLSTGNQGSSAFRSFGDPGLPTFGRLIDWQQQMVPEEHTYLHTSKPILYIFSKEEEEYHIIDIMIDRTITCLFLFGACDSFFYSPMFFVLDGIIAPFHPLPLAKKHMSSLATCQDIMTLGCETPGFQFMG